MYFNCNEFSACPCRNIPSEIYGTFVSLSVKLTLAMQIIGFSVRLSSSLLWMQMYRLGASYMENSVPRDADVDLRNSFLSPTTPIVRRTSGADEVVGGSIYDPAYYSSLFEDGRDDAFLCGVRSSHSLLNFSVLRFPITMSKISHATQVQKTK